MILTKMMHTHSRDRAKQREAAGMLLSESIYVYTADTRHGPTPACSNSGKGKGCLLTSLAQRAELRTHL